jgi:para-nitrobenzyl esterase
VYRYLFTQRLRGQLSALGAFHGLELAFVFGTLGAQGTIVPSPAERALIDSIIGYWTRFAATGDPNGASAAEWPRFDPATDTHIILGTPVGAGAGIRTAQCDFWEELVGS